MQFVPNQDDGDATEIIDGQLFLDLDMRFKKI